MDSTMVVYCLENTHEAKRPTYVGMTNDLQRRLMEHNGSKGKKHQGARFTRRKAKGTWRPLFMVSGFRTRAAAAQLEYAIKHKSVSSSPKNNPFAALQGASASGARRAWQLYKALNSTQKTLLTQGAPPTATLSFTVHWLCPQYHALATSLPWPGPKAVSHVSTATTTITTPPTPNNNNNNNRMVITIID